jgi:predicted RNA methylase
LEDYAARYNNPVFGGGGPANAARYVIEGHVRDATSAEWDWAYEYLRSHPGLLDGPVKSDAQLAEEAAQDRRVSGELTALAKQAYDRGERGEALRLLEQAAELHPADEARWNRLRGLIAELPDLSAGVRAGTEDGEPAPEASATVVGTHVPNDVRDVLVDGEHDQANIADQLTGPGDPGSREQGENQPEENHLAQDGPDIPNQEQPGPVADPSISSLQTFRPEPGTQLTPSGAISRVRANLEALRTLRQLQADGAPANADQQRVLAGWSGWGAVPQVFDQQREEFAWARDQLAQLLDPDELAAAARNTLNAHYTDLSLAAPIWAAVRELGFDTGRVLEPGCGTGNFIGLAPPGADMVGVELEPVSAGIAAALYPRAQILPESFAETRAPAGGFDLVVGNVPFGKVVLADRTHNAARHSIHNHFIIKSLHLLAPGGLVAVLTSRYTLDATNPAARREMAQLADLVGAIRLPESAHQRTAGTKVVTDLLILRRREDEFEPAPFSWELTEFAELPRDTALGTDTAPEADRDGEEVRVNRYFLDYPEMVCGQLHVGRGQFSNAELSVRAPDNTDIAQMLTERLGLLVAHARASELTQRPTASASGQRAALVGRAAKLTDGHITAVSSQEFTTVVAGAVEPLQVPRTQRAELGRLLRLRDTVLQLLEAEAATREDTPEIDSLRALLNQQYDAYLTDVGRSTGSPGGVPGAPTPRPARRCWPGPSPARADSAPIHTPRWSTPSSGSTRRPAKPAKPRFSPTGSSRRVPRAWAPTPRPMRSRSAWTPTAGSICPRSPACGASSRPEPELSWARWCSRIPLTTTG